jgi:hypothetical protein
MNELQINEHGLYTTLPNGRKVEIMSLTFGRARICLMSEYSRLCYDDMWWYDDVIAAVVALKEWNGEGEPAGWFRHPPSGRRRPHNDPEKEYVAPWRK